MIITPEQLEKLIASLKAMGIWEVKKITHKNTYNNTDTFDFRIKSLDSKYQESVNCSVLFYGPCYDGTYYCYPRVEIRG
jgi:hypothetical protein